jgi:transcriptional regulator with XRE-family HTH domain
VARELTQARFSKLFGCSKKQISELECALGNPSMSLLDDVAKGLHCDVADLLRDPAHVDPPKPPSEHFVGQAYNHESPTAEKEGYELERKSL